MSESEDRPGLRDGDGSTAEPEFAEEDAEAQQTVAQHALLDGTVADEEQSFDESVEELTLEQLERIDDLINLATEALAAGRAHQALALAREATQKGPSLVRTWVLLAMIADEAGEEAEALRAYRRVHQLDPDRPGVVERLEALTGEVEEDQVEAEPEEPKRVGFVDRYAPLLLAASVTLLILAIGAAVLVHRHQVASIEAAYRMAMEQGTRYMAMQEYARAEMSFADALRLRPNDSEALAWLQRAQDGRRQLERVRQWEYMTMGGRYPPPTGGNPLTGGKILSTEERKAQEAQQAKAAAGQGEGGGNYPSASSPRRYTWRGATSTDWQSADTSGGFPSPRQEIGTSGFFPEPSGQGTQPQAVSPGQPGYGQQPAQPATPGAAQAPPAGVQQPAVPPQPEGPVGHVRITVGDPRPPVQQHQSQQPQTPAADDVRRQADEARRAGRLDDACRLYKRAADLYQAEAQADPQARALKQASADYCRRASEQCQ